jgi:hypothetical protein
MCFVTLILFRPKTFIKVGERHETAPPARDTHRRTGQMLRTATAVRFFKPTRRAGSPSPEPVDLSDAEVSSIEG